MFFRRPSPIFKEDKQRERFESRQEQHIHPGLQNNHHGPQSNHHGPQSNHHGPQSNHHGPQPNRHRPKHRRQESRHTHQGLEMPEHCDGIDAIGCFQVRILH